MLVATFELAAASSLNYYIILMVHYLSYHQDYIKNLVRLGIMKHSQRNGSWTPGRSRGSHKVAIKIQFFFTPPPYTEVHWSDREDLPLWKGLA